jgi:hyperosmotically inducible periplasmic protein
MKKLALSLALVATLSLGIACNTNKKDQQTSSTENTATGATTSQQQSASNDVEKVNDDNIKAQLDQAKLGDVKVHVDDDKKVINLTGEVVSPDQKSQAEQIAKEHAAGYVVANEVAVRPNNNNHDAKKVDSNLDDSIKSEWKALVAQNNWDNQHINSDVKNGVLTLKGDVDTQSQRTNVEKAAANIPHVKQIVNELTVKNAGK